MRLDRYLSERLGISRSESRKRIASGVVLLDGAVCRKADAQLSEEGCSVTVNGQLLSGQWQQWVYIMLNKPEGVVSASRDGRDKTVVDLVSDWFPRRTLFPAGRLDKASTGFVLLTDDGAFAHSILAPGHHVPKTYLVTLDTPFTSQMQQGFSTGVTLADGKTMAPAMAAIAAGPDNPDANPCLVQVTLRQGVYHQIKRMFGVYHAGVNALHRQSIGNVALDATLEPGQWRELTPEELARLQQPAK